MSAKEFICGTCEEPCAIYDNIWLHVVEKASHNHNVVPVETEAPPQSLTVAGGEETSKFQSKYDVPDNYLNALLHYTGAFYGSAIAHGMKAAHAADAVKHVENAARHLHRLATKPVAVPSPATPPQTDEQYASEFRSRHPEMYAPAEGHPSEPRVWTMAERIAAAKVIHKLRYPSDEEWEREHDAPKWAQRGYDIMTDIAVSLQCELTEIKNRGM